MTVHANSWNCDTNRYKCIQICFFPIEYISYFLLKTHVFFHILKICLISTIKDVLFEWKSSRISGIVKRPIQEPAVFWPSSLQLEWLVRARFCQTVGNKCGWWLDIFIFMVRNILILNIFQFIHRLYCMASNIWILSTLSNGLWQTCSW